MELQNLFALKNFALALFSFLLIILFLPRSIRILTFCHCVLVIFNFLFDLKGLITKNLLESQKTVGFDISAVLELLTLVIFRDVLNAFHKMI